MWDEAERTRWRRSAEAMVKSAGQNDPEAFAELHELANWLFFEGLKQAAEEQRSHGYSWTDLARALGRTRQATRQRFARHSVPVGTTTTTAPTS